jgi:hypothetical protein
MATADWRLPVEQNFEKKRWVLCTIRLTPGIHASLMRPVLLCQVGKGYIVLFRNKFNSNTVNASFQECQTIVP